MTLSLVNSGTGVSGQPPQALPQTELDVPLAQCQHWIQQSPGEGWDLRETAPYSTPSSLLLREQGRESKSVWFKGIKRTESTGTASDPGRLLCVHLRSPDACVLVKADAPARVGLRDGLPGAGRPEAA